MGCGQSQVMFLLQVECIKRAKPQKQAEENYCITSGLFLAEISKTFETAETFCSFFGKWWWETCSQHQKIAKQPMMHPCQTEMAV